MDLKQLKVNLENHKRKFIQFEESTPAEDYSKRSLQDYEIAIKTLRIYCMSNKLEQIEINYNNVMDRIKTLKEKLNKSFKLDLSTFSELNTLLNFLDCNRITIPVLSRVKLDSELQLISKLKKAFDTLDYTAKVDYLSNLLELQSDYLVTLDSSFRTYQTICKMFAYIEQYEMLKEVISEI